MTQRISQMIAASTLTGNELVEVSQPSATVNKTATTMSFDASDNSLNDSGGGLLTAGFTDGKQVRTTGAANGANNIFSARVQSVTANKMIFASPEGDAIVDEPAGASVTVTQWDTRRSTAQAVADVGAGGDAADVSYTPTTPAHWTDPDPTTVQEALDALAAASGGSGSSAIRTYTGTSDTLVLGDAQNIVESNNASANTLTVPPNSSVAFPVGTSIALAQYGAGKTAVAAGAGVTIRSADNYLKLRVRYSTATLYKRGTDEWVLAGDLAP